MLSTAPPVRVSNSRAPSSEPVQVFTVTNRARRGAAEASYTRFGTVIGAHPAPDGRHVAAVISGVAVILDAATLAPLARLALPPGAVIADWRTAP